MPRPIAPLLVRPALAALLMLAAGQGTGIAQERRDSGFELVIVGRQPGFDRERFTQAVMAALPRELLEPGSNFTRAPTYQEDQRYRLVMIFHGDEEVTEAELCTGFGEVSVPPPAPPSDLMSATRVTAAFCQGDEMLSRAEDRMIGSVAPGQAGFNFLVSDVTKQLFPEGFATLPGGTGTTAADTQ